jgi:hypothetical protein
MSVFEELVAKLSPHGRLLSDGLGEGFRDMGGDAVEGFEVL